jgi:hypothetical protein
LSDPGIAARAERAQAEAAQLPTAEKIMDLAARASAHGSRTMSSAEIREIAGKAIADLALVTAELYRLSELMVDNEPASERRGEST